MIFIDENVVDYKNMMKEPNFGEDIIALSPVKAFQRLQNGQEVCAYFQTTKYATFTGCPACRVERDGNYCHTCGTRVKDNVTSSIKTTDGIILILKRNNVGELKQIQGNPFYSPGSRTLNPAYSNKMYHGVWNPSLVTLEDFMKIKYWFAYNN